VQRGAFAGIHVFARNIASSMRRPSVHRLVVKDRREGRGA
jgi:hypothetical protein